MDLLEIQREGKVTLPRDWLSGPNPWEEQGTLRRGMRRGWEISSAWSVVTTWAHLTHASRASPTQYFPFEPLVYKSGCIQLENQSKNRPTKNQHYSRIKHHLLHWKSWWVFLIFKPLNNIVFLSRRRWSILLVFWPSTRTELEPPRRSSSLFFFSLQKRLEHSPRFLPYENGVGTSTSFSLSFLFLSEGEAGAFSSFSALWERGWNLHVVLTLFSLSLSEEAGASSSSFALWERGWNLHVVLTLSPSLSCLSRSYISPIISY